MRNLLLIIALILGFTATSQLKELSLDDAVLSYYKGLTPSSLSRLQWVDKTNNYVHFEKGEYIISTAAGAELDRIILSDLSKAYPDLKALPYLESINDHSITFYNGSQLLQFDYKINKEIRSISFDTSAQNQDYNSKKTALAFTFENNLYVSDSVNSKLAVTAFTDKNIVAGQAIHRYEFGISKGTFWSPKGNLLAFYQKDETHVTNYPLVDVTTYPATLNNIKYPMAGQKSEIAKVGIYNVSTKQTTYLNIDTKDEHYLTNLSWSPDEKYILLAEVNRGQNHYFLNRYDAVTGEKVNTILQEANDRWVEPENDAVFLPKQADKFLWLSEKDGYKNLYIYSSKGTLIKQLTSFKFVIKSILGFDALLRNVIITATGEDGRNTLVYKVDLRTGVAVKLTATDGSHHVSLNKTGTHFIDNYSNLTTPRIIDIVSTKTGKSKNILTADNPLKDHIIGTTEFVTLKSKDNFDLYSRIIKPANFDPNKKYPVLVYVYGGTHAQLVTNSWLGGASMWMHWLANQEEYIVFTLDNRGSANRGFAFESIIHRKAGEAGMEDQLIGVDYLKSLNYVDASRIAVHGWSYGGFMTCSMMLRHPGVFTVGAAGGPVTDWKYYEVMYGERYMDTPQENPEGYANSRVGKYLENLEGDLLLIHGSIDPTVVPQHSMVLLQEAVQKEVQIDFFTYPMHEHNVRGKDRVHLMTKILKYIVEKNQ